MTRSYDWMKGAPCRDKNALFFNETTRSTVKMAIQICNGCAVREACLEHAISHREVGIWGGMTTNQRAKLTRRKRADKANIEPVACSNVSGHGEENQ